MLPFLQESHFFVLCSPFGCDFHNFTSLDGPCNDSKHGSRLGIYMVWIHMDLYGSLGLPFKFTIVLVPWHGHGASGSPSQAVCGSE